MERLKRETTWSPPLQFIMKVLLKKVPQYAAGGVGGGINDSLKLDKNYNVRHSHLFPIDVILYMIVRQPTKHQPHHNDHSEMNKSGFGGCLKCGAQT